MLLAKNFALPLTQSHLRVHLLHRLNQLALHAAAHVELFTARADIALDALTVCLLADVAQMSKFGRVEFSAVHLQFRVAVLKPDLVDPVDTRDVHPLLGLELYHGAVNIRAQHAVG